jgi:hypothetical protein
MMTITLANLAARVAGLEARINSLVSGPLNSTSGTVKTNGDNITTATNNITTATNNITTITAITTRLNHFDWAGGTYSSGGSPGSFSVSFSNPGSRSAWAVATPANFTSVLISYIGTTSFSGYMYQWNGSAFVNPNSPIFTWVVLMYG